MRVPRQLLRDSAMVEPYGGSGAFGPIYGEAVAIRLSAQPTTRVLTDTNGETLAVDVLAIIRPEDGPVRPESVLTTSGIRYRVVECYPMPDERRPSHYELSLSRFAAQAGGSGSGS